MISHWPESIISIAKFLLNSDLLNVAVRVHFHERYLVHPVSETNVWRQDWVSEGNCNFFDPLCLERSLHVTPSKMGSFLREDHTRALFSPFPKMCGDLQLHLDQFRTLSMCCFILF
ncbi:hypothetical protein TNIN_150901 [Trichonephila inaurata madagascariensis]|uniref:Uncharacterized protein n=1 Tax=Trichonephila inaurata madagascariensis TaxID=2747483 RepID=A0A8X6Y385_9ARAC|nr:hypothetical protein TNIN_150901 [Trichonephila inaurata madagascariensis]